MKRGACLIAISISLSGCYSLQGSERILDGDGHITKEAASIGPVGSGSASIFGGDFARARQDRISNPGTISASVGPMLDSGFTHIYSFCDNYFDVMGKQQRKSRIARDTIAPISALITGLLTLGDFGDDSDAEQDLLATLGLATATTASGLDIYDEHMLFGAENVGAVEMLTKKALGVHRASVLKLEAVTYDAAIMHLLDNQGICSPQHILTLTREAIKQGNVVARVPAPADTGTPQDSQKDLENGLGGTTTRDPNIPIDVEIDNSRPSG